MKLLIVLVFLCTGAAFAKSRIGEWAAYDYEESTTTSSVKGLLYREILDEKKMLGPDGKMASHLKIGEKLLYPTTQTKEVIKWEPSAQYYTNLGLNVYVFKCRFFKNMGNIETIKVKAGKFKACKVKDQNSWIGVVPFNHLLFIQDEPNLFRRYELVKYGWKKK
jgi:hypothetical protein